MSDVYVCIYKHASTDARLEESGGCSSRALRLLLGPFLDKSRVVVATISSSQATLFAERGRVWSRCNHRVVPTTET